MAETSKPKKKGTRNVFTPSEDAQLHFLVLRYGMDWEKISNEMPNRSIRQCRERYMNYLAPGVVNGPWTPAEDQLLIEKQKIFGRKWTAIAKFFHNRSGANIKNRWSQMVSNGQVEDDRPSHYEPKNEPKSPEPQPPEHKTHLVTFSKQEESVTSQTNQMPPLQLPPINQLPTKEKLKNPLLLSWNTTLADPLIVESFSQDRKRGQNDVEKFRNFKGFAGLIW